MRLRNVCLEYRNAMVESVIPDSVALEIPPNPGLTVVFVWPDQANNLRFRVSQKRT